MSYGGQGGGAGAISSSSDVALSNPLNGDVLRYSGSSGKWTNATVATGSGNSPFFSVLDYGAVGNGSNNDTAAINSALSAASNGGVVVFPGGKTYVTSGGHNVARKVFLDGRGAIINHTGNNVCFKFQPTDGFALDTRGGAYGIQLNGSNGGNSVGFEVGNQYGWSLRDCNITNVNVGILFNNVNNWVEGSLIDGVKVDNTNAGIRFMRNGGTDSFGYTRIHNFAVNVNGGGAGIDMGSSNAGSPAIYIYHSVVDLTAWLNGANATAVRVGSGCNFDASQVFIVGETTVGSTSTVNNQGGQFRGMGYANVAAASARFSGNGTTQVS